MRTTICCASLALLLAGVATAEDSDYFIDPWKSHAYWQIQGGWSNPDDSDLPDTSSGSISMDDEAVVAAALGFHPFRHVRFDIFEFSWREYSIESGDRSGNFDAYSFLTNVYYVPFPDWRISPFAGVGVGVLYAKGKNSGVDVDSTDFAWNARAGAEFKIIEHMGFVAEYRFLMDNGAIDDDLPIHELLFGLRLKFY